MNGMTPTLSMAAHSPHRSFAEMVAEMVDTDKQGVPFQPIWVIGEMGQPELVRRIDRRIRQFLLIVDAALSELVKLTDPLAKATLARLVVAVVAAIAALKVVASVRRPGLRVLDPEPNPFGGFSRATDEPPHPVLLRGTSVIFRREKSHISR